jgi:hypothetical protein
VEYDFYSGFEGELELIVQCRIAGKVRSSVRLCVGDFDRIMQVVPPADGVWTGIALHYHLDTGFCDYIEWVDDSIGDSLEKMRMALCSIPDPYLRSVVEALILVMEDASGNRGSLVWRYD